MYISKTFRGKGLGTWQVKKAIEWARTNKVVCISTKTWGGNIASRKILQGLGFEITREEPNARINGDSTVRYYFEL